METLEALEARKSVRGYQDKPVEEGKIDIILKYGNKAPIAGEIFMSVITDKKLLDKINDAGKEAAIASGNEFMISRVSIPGYRLTYGAPVLVVISAPAEGFGSVNAACAAENMCIAATDMGLGTCFLAGFLMAFQYKPELLKELSLPDGYVPQCGIIIGYEGESVVPAIPRDISNTNIAYIE